MGARSWSERHSGSPKSASRHFLRYFYISHCSRNVNCRCSMSFSSSRLPKVTLDDIGKNRQKGQTLSNETAQNLPSTVSMPDGEEHPCKNGKTLHIRNREQESELWRSYIRPPPNRMAQQTQTEFLKSDCPVWMEEADGSKEKMGDYREENSD